LNEKYKPVTELPWLQNTSSAPSMHPKASKKPDRYKEKIRNTPVSTQKTYKRSHSQKRY